MSGNTFTQNHVPNRYGLVNLFNIFKISIQGDVYRKNTFAYWEALNTLGAIKSNGNEGPAHSGVFKFSSYIFQKYYNGSSIQGMYPDDYPGPTLYLQGILYLNISSIEFDGNYYIRQPANIISVETTVPAEGISIAYSKGKKPCILNTQGIYD